MKPSSQITKSLPLKMVGSNVFGRYPKISDEQTWNMIITDNWLVNYAGYTLRVSISPTGEGRGIYMSPKDNHMYAAVDNGIFRIATDLTYNRVGELTTYSGEVFFSENNANQIAAADGDNIYIYNYSTGVFSTAITPTLPKVNFKPGYIDFQDGYFLAPQTGEAAWRLSDFNDGTNWPDDANHSGRLQTKPTTCQAVIRVPGQGGMIFVFGQTVAEPWYDTGAQLFPYQRNNSFNVDYGVTNPATIANLENITTWLASNEKSGPFIMYTMGGTPQKISTDGIDFRLADLTHPEDAFGFMFRQDGHMIYQLTFPTDNLSYAYDFNTQKFFSVSDQNQNYHIAKRVVYFNNTYYFVSLVDGNIYELDSDITTYNGLEIPRIRVCPTIRLPDNSRFITQELSFPIEQGVNEEAGRIDLSISNDGAYSFGNVDGMAMTPLGNRLNKFTYWNLGWGNELTPQFRFVGFGRFVLGNGEINIYQ